jgi:hypothetical protein
VTTEHAPSATQHWAVQGLGVQEPLRLQTPPEQLACVEMEQEPAMQQLPEGATHGPGLHEPPVVHAPVQAEWVVTEQVLALQHSPGVGSAMTVNSTKFTTPLEARAQLMSGEMTVGLPEASVS